MNHIVMPLLEVPSRLKYPANPVARPVVPEKCGALLGPPPKPPGPHPLPETLQAMLDTATLNRLFRDVAEAAELLEVSIKGSALQPASQQPVGLEEARALLLAGCVRGVQLRYRFEGVEWWDTLSWTPEGARLVRIRRVWEGE